MVFDLKTFLMKKRIQPLQIQYADICAQYVIEFCKKQGLTFEGWAGDHVGGMGLFGDYYFNFDDIRKDIDTNQPKGVIMQWQSEGIEAHFAGLETQNMNYSSYIKGLRFK